MTSSEYSDLKLSEYEKIIMDGDALVDLVYVKKFGISTKSTINFYVWKAILSWAEKHPRKLLSVPEIIDIILVLIKSDPPALPFIPEKTSVYHSLNKFRFIGLLYLITRSTTHLYVIEDEVINKGFHWFRVENKHMKGLFQCQHGLFEINL